jgi:hypothetical protein
VEIATLEATVKAELEEKNEVLDQLMKERGGNFYVTLSIATLAAGNHDRLLYSLCVVLCFVESNETLHQEIRDLKVNHFSLKEKHDEVSEKMRFFTKVTGNKNAFIFFVCSYCLCITWKSFVVFRKVLWMSKNLKKL